jgi:hypothetical protein
MLQFEVPLQLNDLLPEPLSLLLPAHSQLPEPLDLIGESSITRTKLVELSHVVGGSLLGFLPLPASVVGLIEYEHEALIQGCVILLQCVNGFEVLSLSYCQHLRETELSCTLCLLCTYLRLLNEGVELLLAQLQLVRAVVETLCHRFVLSNDGLQFLVLPPIVVDLSMELVLQLGVRLKEFSTLRLCLLILYFNLFQLLCVLVILLRRLVLIL